MQPQDNNTSAENARNLFRNRKPGLSRTATRRRARLIWMSRNGGAEPTCRPSAHPSYTNPRESYLNPGKYVQ